MPSLTDVFDPAPFTSEHAIHDQTSTDTQLVLLARSGEVGAFTELVQRHQGRVYAVALAYTRDAGLAEDVTQEAFVAGWQELDKLTDPKMVGPWLCGIARNLSHRMGSRGKREQTGQAAVVGEGTEEATPLHRLMEHEAEASIWELLDRVPVRYREVMLLHYGAEQSVAKIAQSLEMSESAVKKRLSRGREMMRDRAERFAELAGACRPPAALATAVALLIGRESASAQTLVSGGLIAKVLAAKKVLASAAMLLLCSVAFFAYRAQATGTHTPDQKSSQASVTSLVLSEVVSPAQPSRLRGKVVDDVGEPIADAHVLLKRAGAIDLGVRIREDGQLPQIALSSQDGAFALETPAGEYTIHATAPGFIGGIERVQLVPDDQREIRIVLSPGGVRLHGTVSDIGGGPVEGAIVSVKESPGQSAPAVPTGSDGSYELWLAPGASKIEVSHGDYAAQAQEVIVTGTHRQHDVGLVPGGTIEGVVVNTETRLAVAGAIVMVRGEVGAVSDAQGRFRVEGLPAGISELRAFTENSTTEGPVRVDMGIGETRSLELPLATGYRVSGVVLDSEELPVANAAVELGLLSGDNFPALRPTDAEGRFEIVGVYPGTFVLAAKHPDYPLSMRLSAVQVEEQDREDVIVQLEPGRRLSGRISPPGPATIQVSMGNRTETALAAMSGDLGLVGTVLDATTRTELDGSFTLPTLGQGRYEVVATADDGRHGTAVINLGEDTPEGVDIHLGETITIHGKLVDSMGAAVSSVSIAVTSQDLSIAPQGAVTDQEGHFSMPGLFPGEFRLEVLDPHCRRVFAGEGRPKDSAPLVIEGAQRELDLKTLEVSTCDSTVAGRVVDAQGSPVADAWIHVTSKEFRSRPLLTGSDGSYELRDLPDEVDFTLHVAHPVYGGARIANPQQVETVVLKGKAGVALQIEGLGPSPGRCQLSLRGPVELKRNIEDPGGIISLSGMPVGRYSVTVVCDAGQAIGTLSLGAESESLSTFRIEAWASLEGRALALDGSPLSEQPLLPVGRDWLSAHSREALLQQLAKAERTDRDGHFALERVPPGTQAIVSLSEAGILAFPLSVAAGEELELGTVTFSPN